MFLRQLALHAAAGRDPFDTRMFIDPIRVLQIDAENAYFNGAAPNRTGQHVHHDRPCRRGRGQVVHLASWEAGVDLRSCRGRSELEAVIQQTRPDLIIAGPLYKLMSRGQRDVQQAALEFTSVIDDLRMRYRFAIIIEAHMAKSQTGSYRTSDPKGSVVWKQWPEIGRALRADDEEAGIYDLEFFRARNGNRRTGR